MVMELVERNNREFFEKGKEEGKAEGIRKGIRQGKVEGIRQGIKENSSNIRNVSRRNK